MEIWWDVILGYQKVHFRLVWTQNNNLQATDDKNKDERQKITSHFKHAHQFTVPVH